MEPQPAAPQTPTMSLAGRLINIFATPGEVFDEVKAAPPSVANWLLPILLSAVVGTLASFAMFSQPAIQQQIREQQAKVLEQQVKAGKMSQADADRAEAMMEKFSGPAMLAIFGSLAAVFFSAIHAVWWGFLLWLAARWFLKTRITYAKSLEVAGLAMMITMLSGIITILLTVVLGRMAATPSLALLVTDFNPTRRSHATMVDRRRCCRNRMRRARRRGCVFPCSADRRSRADDNCSATAAKTSAETSAGTGTICHSWAGTSTVEWARRGCRLRPRWARRRGCSSVSWVLPKAAVP